MSDKQAAANRRNAKKSSGPASRAGKQRSAQNALKHGLSVPIDPGNEDVRALAALLSPATATDHVAALALEAARRVIDYDRVRAAHKSLYSRLGNSPILANSPSPLPVKFRSVEQRLADLMRLCQSPIAETPSFADAARALSKLARYERRAFSLRDQALQELTEALRAKPSAN